MNSFKKILVIKFRALGDTVIMTAPLAALRTAYPKAEIHVAVTDQWSSLLEAHPGVQKVWRYTKHKDIPSRAKAIANLGFRLRKEKYDCVINFHASPSSSTLAFAMGSDTRSIHFHGHHDKNKYSTVEIPGKGIVKPAVERDMDALRALGLKIPSGLMPEIYLSQDEIKSGEGFLNSKQLKAPLLVLGVGASRPTKVWPLEYYAKLSEKWVNATGGTVAALVGPGEEELGLRLIQESRTPITKIENQNIRMVAAILKNAAVFVGNDSGPKHLAVSVKTPTVTLMGPEHPLEWHPYPKERHPYFFIEGLSCRQDALSGHPEWCGLKTCEMEKQKCMRLISADDVFIQCLNLYEAQAK